MSYQLGIDFGTMNLSAAVRRSDGPPQPVALRGDGVLVPAALHLGRDGRVTVGDGALRLAGIDAGRVVRGVKRRVGDPAPVVLGGAEWTAEAVAARLVGWVVERVAEREGGPAATVVLAHPATWTPATLRRFAAALDDVGVAATFLPEPVAAALAAAEIPGDRAEDPVVVYDLGGGGCDVAVLRRTADDPGLAVLGRPESVADGSGLDLDELVSAHVRGALADGAALDAQARRACVRAKEALSTRDEVVVRAGRDAGRVAVRLDRAGFEDLIAPAVSATLAAVRRAVASAGLDAAAPLTVLLTGGGARIPLVARMVADELGRPVTVVDDPQLLVARGAALVAPPPAPELAAAPAVAAPAVAAPALLPPHAGPVPDAVAAVGSAPVDAAPDGAAPDGAAPDGAAIIGSAPDSPAAAGSLLAGSLPAGAAPDASATADSPPAVAAPVAPAAIGSEPAGSAPDSAAPDSAAPDGLALDGPTPDGSAAGGEKAAPAFDPHEPVPPRAAPRRIAATRPPAVLDRPLGRGRRRSLARLLAGAGAVAAATLAVVALFRPDGPLDPPTEVAGPGVVQVTGPAVAPGPPVAVAGAGVPDPAAAPVRIRALTDQITLAPTPALREPAAPASSARGPRTSGPTPARADGPVRASAAAPRTPPTPAVGAHRG